VRLLWIDPGMLNISPLANAPVECKVGIQKVFLVKLTIIDQSKEELQL
jgi:hypothetical protein